MISVTQKHVMACGLACVAFVAKASYDQLAKTVSDEQLNNRGFYCPELVELLNQNRLNYSWKKLSETEKNKDFKPGDIVFVEPSRDLPFGHFLTRTVEGWMDPWINLLETKDISKAKSGFRPSLPGRAEYLVYPSHSS